MKKALIISCYMGKLPDWIDMWLFSCSNNPNFDFLLVTDDEIKQTIPQNVKILQEDLKMLKKRFQKHFEFEISLETAYKLCDYKPIYGLAFEEFLKEYKFWGHCDIDLIFGDISKFFTEDLLEQYDRIGTFGHLILYRNNENINHLYKKRGSSFSYRTIFSKKDNFCFDEQYGYNMICKKNHVKWLDCGHTYILDRRTEYPLAFGETKNYPCQKVLWKDNKIYQVYCDENGTLKWEEKMYYHFSGIKYKIPNTKNKVLLFDYNTCKVIDEKELKQYLQQQDEVEKVISRKKIKWDSFKKKTIYQKYVYIRQKFYYYVLKR